MDCEQGGIIFIQHHKKWHLCTKNLMKKNIVIFFEDTSLT